MIKGYKCFYKDLKNLYNIKFEIGKTYSTTGNIKYGIYGNGFHMCKNIEDTFKFFDIKNNKIEICEVIGLGKIVTYEDKYYDYYDMYSVEKIYIKRKLIREEIIEIGLNLPEIRLVRFIEGYKLTDNEINLFKNKFYNNKRILNYISYYQENKEDVFKLTFKKQS